MDNQTPRQDANDPAQDGALRPEQPSGPSSGPQPGANARGGPVELEPIELEDHSRESSVRRGIPIQPETASVKALDVCPNCGASMRGSDVLVCMRCGFDLKTMRVIETARGEVEPPELAEPELISPPGRGDFWLPGALAGICGAFLLIGYLSGAHGLFPGAEAIAAEEDRALGSVPALQRVTGALRAVVLIGMWTACGLGALTILGYLLSAKLGDIRLAAVRVLGVVTAMRLVSILNFDSPTLEWIIEAAAQGAIAIGLSLALFRLKPRDAPTLAGAAIIIFLLIWLGSFIVSWAAGR